MAKQAIKITGNIDAMKQSINALNSCMVELINNNQEDSQPEVRLNLPDCITIIVHGKNDQKKILERIDKAFSSLYKTEVTTVYGRATSYLSSNNGNCLLTVTAMPEKDAYSRNWSI